MILQGVHRFHKDGWHSSFAWIQVVCWSVIFTMWSLRLAQSWHFENDRLVMKRVLLPDLNIPYASITSVDWTNQWHTSLKLGGIPIVRGMGKRIIMVRDVSGFLDELEHHVESSVLHV
jgi:hypothetical protein